MPRPRTQNRADVRSERISLVLTPATYSGLRTLAEINGASVNDLLNSVVEQLVERNAVTIREFDEARARAANAVVWDVPFKPDIIDVAAQIEGGDDNENP